MYLWEGQATLDDGEEEEEEVLEVLKIIKDKLLLALHIDIYICDKAGLPSPPCFMRLPTDIQNQDSGAPSVVGPREYGLRVLGDEGAGIGRGAVEAEIWGGGG